MTKSWDIQKMLQGSKWKRSEGREAKHARQGIFRPGKEEIYLRQVRGEWVELKLLTGTWDSQLFLYVEPPVGASREERDKYLRTVLFEDAGTVEYIDRVAEDMVTWKKGVKPPRRKRKVAEEFRWGRSMGAEGFAEWKAEVRKELSGWLRSQKSRVTRHRPQWGVRPDMWVSQPKLMGLILDEYQPEQGLPRAQARREVAVILRAMEKEGLVVKVRPGDVDRHTHWFWKGEYDQRTPNPGPKNLRVPAMVLVGRLKF